MTRNELFWRAWKDLVDRGFVEPTGEVNENGRPLYRKTALFDAWAADYDANQNRKELD
jgi:hypothetical protein